MQPDNQQLQPQPDQPQTYPEGEPAESMGANQQTAVGPQASGAPGSINPTETEALPDNIDPSLISAAKKREIEAANVVKRGLPKWIKPAAIAVGVLTLVGLGVWAFFVYYWNSNEQVMMRILSTVAQQSPASTNSTVSIDYKDMNISADVDYATDGQSGQFGFDGEIRYGSNRYDTALTLVGDSKSYMLRLKNPRQFLYDLSGVYAITTQTDGMYDVISDRLDNKWLELDNKTIEELAGTDKLAKSITCTATGTGPIRTNQMAREELADLFKQNPFLSIQSGRDDVVNGIKARTYVLRVSESSLNSFIDSYATSEAWRQALKCYGPDLKNDLKKVAKTLENDYSFTISVSKSSLKILKISGSTSENQYSIVFETIFSQEKMGTINKPNPDLTVKDIEEELKPINIWLKAQRTDTKIDKQDEQSKESSDKTTDKETSTTQPQ